VKSRDLSTVQAIRKKKKLGAYPSVSVVFSITLSVLVMGVLGVLMIFYQSQSDIIKKHITVHVYLDKELSLEKIDSIKTLLSTQKYTLMEEGKPVISYINKEEAAKKFINETGEDFANLLGDNPLRDAFLLNVQPQYTNAKNLRKIKNALEEQSGIYEVVYFENLVENINNILPKIGFALLSIALLFVFISIILIHNSIRLAMYSQRFLIRSMQLIGAKPSFIRKPFLVRAVLLGLLSGVIAAFLLFVTIWGLDQYLDEFDVHLHIYHTLEVVVLLFLAMLLIGALIGLASTTMAVNKYLKMKLEDLY
jgi:cell division transport system permease protein